MAARGLQDADGRTCGLLIELLTLVWLCVIDKFSFTEGHMSTQQVDSAVGWLNCVCAMCSPRAYVCADEPCPVGRTFHFLEPYGSGASSGNYRAM